MPNPTVTAAAVGLPSLSLSDLSHPTAGDPLFGSEGDTPIVRHGNPGGRTPRSFATATRIVIFMRDNIGTHTEPTYRTTAVFPCEPAMDGMMLGFTREEGHMACSALWFDMSCRASPEEYQDLAAYLMAKGNVLDIRHRLTPAMHRTREHQHAVQVAEAAQAVQLPNEALLACIRAAGITSQVTGVPQAAIIEEAPAMATAQPARWIAMYLAKHSFNVSPREIAWAYGRSVPGVDRLVRRVEDMRRSNRSFAAMMDRLESLALVEKMAFADGFEIAA